MMRRRVRQTQQQWGKKYGGDYVVVSWYVFAAEKRKNFSSLRRRLSLER